MDETAAESLLRALLARVLAGEPLGGLVSSEVDPSTVRMDLEPIARAEPDLDWLAVNGERVDASVTSADREWRIVFGASKASSLDWLSIYQRPLDFDGVAGGQAIVINGPSGAGKSTLLREIQRLDSARPWVIFDEPESVGSVGAEFLIWRDRYPTLHVGFLAAISALAAAGNLVAVAAGGLPQYAFAEQLADVHTTWVGLFCEAEVLRQRERQRLERPGGLADASLAVHAGWRYDLTFDTTKAGVGDWARQVLASLPS